MSRRARQRADAMAAKWVAFADGPDDDEPDDEGGIDAQDFDPPHTTTQNHEHRDTQ